MALTMTPHYVPLSQAAWQADRAALEAKFAETLAALDKAANGFATSYLDGITVDSDTPIDAGHTAFTTPLDQFAVYVSGVADRWTNHYANWSLVS